MSFTRERRARVAELDAVTWRSLGSSVIRSTTETVLIGDGSDAAEPTLTLSPDDRHVAYVTRDTRRVVLDGQPQPTFDRIVYPLFQP